MFRHLKNYRLVYSFLWRTYGQSWAVRWSFILRLAIRIGQLVVIPIATSILISSLAAGSFDSVWQVAWLYIGTIFVIGVTQPISRYIGMLGENPIYKRLTGEYFAKLISSDIDYFNSNMSGYLTTATRQYLDSGLQLVRAIRNKFLATILSIVFPLIVILCFDLVLGLAVLLMSIVQAIFILWSSKLIEKYRAASRQLYRKNSGRISDAISNIVAIRAASQESTYSKKVEQGAEEEAVLFTKRYTVQSKTIAGREVIVVLFFLIIIALLVTRAESGIVSLTTAVLVLTYMTTIITTINGLADDIDEHDDYIDKLVPAFEVLNRENKINDPLEPIKISNVKGNIKFHHVSFSYSESGKSSVVFDDLCLTIPHGQKLGVVGVSGVGKSTLTKLLLRFEDVSNGSVTLDGHDIRQFRQTDLRRQIAYVPQEPLLFHASILDNVILTKPDANQDQVEEALRAAHAWEFTQKLPDGVHSIVGERGVKLSGGQKQRVAIARAFLQHSPIIVLDEATSALDSESERIIKKSLKRVLDGKTSIVIAHRLSTLSDMDRIVVIGDGKVIEDGDHESLISADGTYAKMWRRQQRGLEVS